MSSKFRRFLQRPVYDQANQLRRLWFRLKTKVFYARFFGAIGPGTLIFKPVLIAGPKDMYLGAKVMIQPGVRLETVRSSPDRTPRLEIHDNANLEQHCQIVCHNRVTIGRNVSVAANCCIVDVTHPYGDPNGSSKFADRVQDDDAEVVVGEGSFIGFGSVVLPGVHIGRHAVIGANSVVTRDIPDYCVAAGVPARVQKRFNPQSRTWYAPEPRASQQ